MPTEAFVAPFSDGSEMKNKTILHESKEGVVLIVALQASLRYEQRCVRSLFLADVRKLSSHSRNPFN